MRVAMLGIQLKSFIVKLKSRIEVAAIAFRIAQQGVRVGVMNEGECLCNGK